MVTSIHSLNLRILYNCSYDIDMNKISDYDIEMIVRQKMKSGCLLNPRRDKIFKALFTSPTRESRIALHSFLEAVIGRKIEKVTVTANEAPLEFSEQRGINYDIQVTFDDLEIANVEMQARQQDYDYGDRAAYLASRLQNTYMEKGQCWDCTPKVYQSNICP